MARDMKGFIGNSKIVKSSETLASLLKTIEQSRYATTVVRESHKKKKKHRKRKKFKEFYLYIILIGILAALVYYLIRILIS